MKFDLSSLPENVKLEITKGDLIEFAKVVMNECLQPTQEPPDMNEIFTFKNACEFLNLSASTVYRKTSKNEIPHFKRGGKLYFKKSELIVWIEEGRQKTQKEIDQIAEDYLKRQK